LFQKDKSFFRKYQQAPLAYRLVAGYDTFNALTKHFKVEPNVFFDNFFAFNNGSR
jgi:hypothetical protein